jgi:hypothetical protein
MTASMPRAQQNHRGARASVVVRALACSVLLTTTGCDSPYQQFLDAIPTAEIAPDEPAEVFLGIDGLSRQAFDRARDRGAFADYATADLITAFPGTSDYAWTRTLRAGPIGGYELQYFDPERNAMQNDGFEGLADHPLKEGLAGTLPCYGRFDFLGNGTTWQLDSYLDPAAAFPPTLDALFDTVVARARTKRRLLAYLLNVDVMSHLGDLEQTVDMLVELDRRIREFQHQSHRPIRFTLFADHGNAHIPSRLVDPRQILTDVGVTPLDALPATPTPGLVEAVPVVHTRVSYAAVHTGGRNDAVIAARASTHPDVDLAVAHLPAVADGTPRYGVWRAGKRYSFSRDAAGAIRVDDPATWDWLALDFAPWMDGATGTAVLADRDAFEATRTGPYPDIFYRVATAFSNPAIEFPADVLLSMPDDVASVGFTIPGAGEIRAASGFHGSLTRAATVSVLASQSFTLPAAVRSDDLADMFPTLRGGADVASP